MFDNIEKKIKDLLQRHTTNIKEKFSLAFFVSLDNLSGFFFPLVFNSLLCVGVFVISEGNYFT